MRSSLRRAALIRYSTRLAFGCLLVLTVWAAAQPTALEQGFAGTFGIGLTACLLGLSLFLPRQGLVVQRPRHRVLARK